MNPLEKEQAKLEREAKKERDKILAHVKSVAQTRSGKEVIWEILSMCNMYSTTFTGNSQGAYLEGRRAVGLDILSLLEEMDDTFYPNLILQMRKNK